MGRKRIHIPRYSATQWRELAEQLAGAQQQHPQFLSFQTCASICRILSGVEEAKVLAARLKLEVVPRQNVRRKKGLINRKRKGTT
jgi:hypothetical protein